MFCPKLNKKYQAIILILNPGTLKIILGPKDIGKLVFCGLVNYNCAVAIGNKQTNKNLINIRHVYTICRLIGENCTPAV